MKYLHEVWLNGIGEPHRLRLENDDLFKKYRAWLQSAEGFTDKGVVFDYTEKDVTRTVAFNFSSVASMSLEKIDEPNERRSLGFFTPR